MGKDGPYSTGRSREHRVVALVKDSIPKDSRTLDYRATPALTTLAVLAAVNWFVFAGVSMSIGGHSVGTLPSKDGFVVTSHGNDTKVSEQVWIFALFYPYLTLTITPAVGFFFLRRHVAQQLHPGLQWIALLFFLLWAIFWYYTWSREALTGLTRLIRTPGTSSVDSSPVVLDGPRALRLPDLLRGHTSVGASFLWLFASLAP